MSMDPPKERDLGQTNRLSVVIVAARYNSELVDSLLEHTVDTLKEAGLSEIKVERVPGSAELPYAAQLLAKALAPDVIIALGVVIAGETEHHHVIANTTAHSLNHLSADKAIPIINGIIVTNSIEEAQHRCGSKINRGKEFAHAAVEMAQLKHLWNQKKK